MFCEIESLLNRLAFDYDVLFPYAFINFYGAFTWMRQSFKMKRRKQHLALCAKCSVLCAKP